MFHSWLQYYSWYWFLLQDENECIKKWLCRDDADYRDKLLACGALIVAELRLQVLEETEFTCSAGIAHNKVEIVFHPQETCKTLEVDCVYFIFIFHDV